MNRLRWTLACWLIGGAAHAQPAPSPSPPGPAPVSEAERLFQEGRELAQDGNYAAACARFTKSFEIDHALGTELNLADCEEKVGHLRLAWRLFLAAADESERSDDSARTEFARSRANALAARLTEIVINVATPTAPGLRIEVAGHILEPAPIIRDRTEPGDIAIVATLPERAPFETTVHGVAGATITVDVPPFGAPIVAAPPHVPEGPTRRRPGRIRVAWGLAAGSAVTAIAGTVFALKGRRDYDATADGPGCERIAAGVVCDDAGDARIADAQRLANIGTGLAIATGALLVGSAVLYLTAPRDRLTIVPTATADRVGVSVGLTF